MFNKFGRRDSKGFGRKPLSNNSYVNTVVRNIRECGQHVCGVRDPNNVDPLFYYTIGNSFTSDAPVEFFCFWKSDLGGVILNMVSYQMNRCPEFRDSVLSHEISYHWGFLGLNEETPIALRVMSGFLEDVVRDKYVCQLGKEEFSSFVRPHQLIQVVLPDFDNHFPGDPCFDEDLLDTIPEYLHLPYDPQVYSVS